MSTENQWLSVQDVADLLQIKSETVRRWIRRRELPVLELGGPRSAYRISRQDLNAFIWQRYRKRPKDSAGQDEGSGIPRSRSTTSVTVESQQNTQTAIAATMDSHPSPAPESESHDHAEEQRFVSLLRRIPGVTYVTTVNPETGETTGRSFAFVNPEFEARLGESASELQSSDRAWWDRVHPDDRERVQQARRHSYCTGERLTVEYRLVNRQGETIWVRDEAVPGDDSDDAGPVWQGIVLDITDHKKVESDLQARLRQHAAIAELGEHALRESDIQHLLDESVVFVQQSLDVEFVKVLELLPGGNELLLRAGTGWKPRLVGNARVSAGTESQAGYTLLSNEPILVTDVLTESRFTAPPLFTEHGIRSGMSVLIAGYGMPWGVLGAHSTTPRDFSVNDLAFLQSVANILASAIRAAAANQTVRRWLSIKDIAEILRVKEETVRRWIRRGELPVIDLGSFRAGYRIHPSDLEHFIRERYMKP